MRLGRRLGLLTAATTLLVFSRAKATLRWTLDGSATLNPGQTLPAIAEDPDGYAVAVAKPKAATKPVHHTLRYIAGGILIVVILVVAAVLLVDRRRKLSEGAAETPPTQSQPLP